MYELRLRYVYTFYSCNELLSSEARDESVKVDTECRFSLYQQEDSSFILSKLYDGVDGKYVVVTYPNKEKTVICEGKTAELVYDEYYDSMGDDNHNVYEGALTLEKVI